MIEHDFDGYLVEPNENSIYEGMKLFLTNTEITEKFKKNMVQSVEKFDNEKIYSQVTSVFQKQYQLKE